MLHRLLEVIIESKWWSLALGLLRMRRGETPCSNFKALIKGHPHLAKKVMDHCVSNEEKDGEQIHYHILEDKIYVMEGQSLPASYMAFAYS